MNKNLKKKKKVSIPAQDSISPGINKIRRRLTPPKTVSIQAMDREYKNFIKDYGTNKNRIPLTSSTTVRPNTNLKRQTTSTITHTINETGDTPPGSSGWTAPKKTSKIHPNDNQTPENQFATANSFESLFNDLQTEDGTGTDGNSNDTITSNIPVNTQSSKIIKPPPIYLQNIRNIKDIIQSLADNNIGKQDFYIRQISNDGLTTVQPSNIENHKKITEILIKNNQQYYTYTPKSLRPKTIVLKGISGEFNEQDIKDEIEELKLQNTNILKITKMKTSQKNSHRNIFLIQLTHDSELVHIKRVYTLLYQKIRWEHLRKSTIYQCKKCQRLGHANVNCNMPFRCVKCSETHEPGKCTIAEQSNKELLKCANCGKSGHPANYRGCPYYKFIEKRTKEMKNDRLIQPPTRNAPMYNRRIDQNITFAQATADNGIFKSTTTTQHTNAMRQPEIAPPNWVNDLKAEIINSLTNSIANLAAQLYQNKQRIDLLFKHTGLEIQTA